MSIDAKQKELVVKLVGMFGSDFDGERATAAKKISDAAKARKITTADFLRLCFGSENSSKKEYRWTFYPISQLGCWTKIPLTCFAERSNL